MYDQLIQRCETDLRAGLAGVAAQRLKTVVVASVPREDRLPLANLCRRAGNYTMGLRLLTPLIHPDKKILQAAPTAREQAEYAVLLLKSGAVAEAMRRLSVLNAKEIPEVPLFQAFCHMAEWDYAKSIPALEKYLHAPISDYSKLVASVNLVSCYVAEDRISEASPLLEKLVSSAREGGFHRLLANCLELRTQVWLAGDDLARASADLDEASQLLASSRTADQLFIMKWRAVIEATKLRDIGPLMGFKFEALQRKHWESVREADFQSLRVKFEADRFHHLLWGTPHAAFRNRIERKLGRKPMTDYLVLGPEGAPHLDLRTGSASLEKGLKPGKKIHQIIEILLRDFYRPIGIASVFAGLYTEEQFNVMTSPNRVHQIINRARTWFADQGVPVEIESLSEGFFMKSRGQFAFRIPAQRESVAGPRALIERLRDIFATWQDFTAVDARAHLALSEPTMRRILRWGLEEGFLEKMGSGRSTTYRLKQTTMTVAA